MQCEGAIAYAFKIELPGRMPLSLLSSFFLSTSKRLTRSVSRTCSGSFPSFCNFAMAKAQGAGGWRAVAGQRPNARKAGNSLGSGQLRGIDFIIARLSRRGGGAGNGSGRIYHHGTMNTMRNQAGGRSTEPEVHHLRRRRNSPVFYHNDTMTTMTIRGEKKTPEVHHHDTMTTNEQAE